MADDLLSPLQRLTDQDDADRAAAIARLPPRQLGLMLGTHHLTAHAGQLPPDGEWNTWLILAGRGFGKTRAGAAWVDAQANALPRSRIALVGATLGDARAVMVEGDAGVLAVARAAGAAPPGFEPSRRLLTWTNGSTATLFSANEPDTMRGPSFHCAWGDEAAKWTDPDAALSNLRFALRLGPTPRLVLTTTPRPLAWLKAMADPATPGVVITRGTTHDNRAHLPPSFLAAVTRDYGGTRLGRQELGGEIIDDLDGALWTRGGIETARVRVTPARVRTVVGVDPPASSGSNADTCGIIVVGLGTDGRGYVLADRSVHGRSPEGWASAVVAAADEFTADRVVAEVNNGGEMVVSVLRAVDPRLPIKPVRAALGKIARAEPVAALYGMGRVGHVGTLPDLEDQLCGLMTGGGYAGPGRSPDRADALVWALTELMLGKPPSQPGVRQL